MTETNRRHIEIVLDRSGSMQSVKTDTEGGLKAFLAEQANAEGDTTVSLRQFDDRYETAYENVKLADVPEYTLRPRGNTALLDAVGKTIATLSERLEALDISDRPHEVIIVILTDGYENCSREWTREQLKETVAKRTAEGWVFVFLGADQDAFAAAGGIGIGRETTLSYGSDHTEASIATASAMVTRGSKSGTYGFTDDERDATSA